MNLSDIREEYRSHPGYPLKKHINNIAKSFSSNAHKETALFHDLGKLSKEFQLYINGVARSKRTTHALESAFIYLLLKNYQFSPETFTVFISILKHHGDLEDINSTLYDKYSFLDTLLENHSDFQEKIRKICKKIHLESDIDAERFCSLFDTETFVEDNSLNSIQTYFNLKDIFSRLIFADKHDAIFKNEYSETKSANWTFYKTRLIDFINTKSNRMSKVRNSAREDIVNNFKNYSEKKVFIIEAPTGLGKTFSALHLALEIAEVKNKKRIINALPMTSIIDQTYEEYSKVINEDDLLKYHHLTRSKNYVDTLREEKSEQQQCYQKNDFVEMSWSSEKVIVTTFNQIFNLFFSNKNRDLIKFWTIRDSVIILDEIQAIPRILLRDISATLNFLAIEFNIDFILMSATVPDIKSFIKPEIVAELLDNKYFEMEFNNRYTLSLRTEINDAGGLVEHILQKYEQYESILCVVNTKKLSLDVFEQLDGIISDDEELYLLNTNFIPRHRIQILHEINNRLKGNKKTILVATQVVEAGVDLDFNYGIREFAPLFSIIQTAGRINREGLKNNAELIITEEISKRSPYHQIDLLKSEVMEIFNHKVTENKILPFLKQYYQMTLKRTYRDSLLTDDMELLNFATVYKNFTDCFMKDVPGIKPVFIETELGLYDKYHLQMEDIFTRLNQEKLSLSEKMNYKSKLKLLGKEISQYVINVSEKEIVALQDFNQHMEIKLCSFNFVISEDKYTARKGWTGKEALEIIC